MAREGAAAVLGDRAQTLAPVVGQLWHDHLGGDPVGHQLEQFVAGVEVSSTPPTARSARTPVACAGGSTSRPASSLHRPVVFLDEPTTGLDPASRADMWSAIEGLVDEGAALLLTTQYLDEADRLADQIIVLSGGKTVAAGTPAELKARVGERRVHLSLRDDEALQGAARVFERLDPELDHRARRLSVPAPEGPQDLRAVLDALEHAGVAVEEAALSRPTLDDAFFALAGEEAVR